jgi:hypothetical protein
VDGDGSIERGSDLQEGAWSALPDDPAGAIELLGRARSAGVPVELLPEWHTLSGLSRLLAGQPDEAVADLESGWREFPDYAALPAVLGTCYLERGEAERAARTLLAALLGDDPDGSLARFRALLTRAGRTVAG